MGLTPYGFVSVNKKEPGAVTDGVSGSAAHGAVENPPKMYPFFVYEEQRRPSVVTLFMEVREVAIGEFGVVNHAHTGSLAPTSKNLDVSAVLGLLVALRDRVHPRVVHKPRYAEK